MARIFRSVPIIAVSFLCSAGTYAQSITQKDLPVPTVEHTEQAPKNNAPQESETRANAVKLRGLNKVTARISTLEAPLGTVMRFGNIEIIAHRCWQSAPEEKPESAVLMEIWELKPTEEPLRIFSGWMFASSPALSALEHPVYDVTVLSCSSLPLKDE